LINNYLLIGAKVASPVVVGGTMVSPFLVPFIEVKVSAGAPTFLLTSWVFWKLTLLSARLIGGITFTSAISPFLIEA